MSLVLSAVLSLLSWLPTPVSASTLEALDAPDFSVREAATTELLTDSSVDLAMLRDLFAAATTPEQRHRLLDVIRHHVVRDLREQHFAEAQGHAAIGFSHEILREVVLPHEATRLPGDPPAANNGRPNPGPASTGGAVHVLATLPGFPGHAHFQPGDLIIAINGGSLPASLTAESFKTILQQWQAGQHLSFTVLRYGEPIRIQLRLASVDALASIYGNTPQLRGPYLEAWHAVRNDLQTLMPPVPVLEVRK